MTAKFALFASVVALVLSSAAQANISTSSGGGSSGGGHSGGGGGGHSGGGGGGHGGGGGGHGFSGVGVSAHAFGGHAGGYAVAGVGGHGMGHAAAAAVAAHGAALHAGSAQVVSLHTATEKATLHAQPERVAALSHPPHHPPGKPRPTQPNHLHTPFDHERYTGPYTGTRYAPCVDSFPSVVNNGRTVCGQPFKAPVNPQTGAPIG
jgi:hypothetical protein